MDRHLLTFDEQMDKREKSIDAISTHLDILIKRENFQDKMITLLACGTGVMIAVLILASLNGLTP